MKERTTEQSSFYKTSDLPLAVTLSLYFPLISVDKSSPRRARFAFEKTGVLEEFIDRFWRRELRIEPIEFSNQTRVLKTRIYSKD